MKNFKMFELTGSNACNKGRNFGFKAEEKKRENYDKAIAVKDILDKAMFEGSEILSDSELRDMIDEKFEHISYNELEREAHKKDAFSEIKRYLDYEDRAIIRAVPADIEVVPGMMEVKVTPDFVVLDPTPQKGYFKDPKTGNWVHDIIYDGIVEIIKVKTGKPISGVAAENDIGLYAMLQYGKNFIKPGTRVIVKASYYFLRQTDDKPLEGKFDEFGEKNIRSMTDAYDGSQTILDKRMTQKCRDFYNGHDDTTCNKQDCEDCALYDICKAYCDGPISVEGELKRHVADIQFTADQSEAIEYDKGIVRINAGAGSGKTLVVVFRVITLLFNGVKPEEILLISFTNTAAAEMKERIKLYAEDWGLEADLDKLRICTFHAFGNDILHEKYQDLGFSKEPHVMDEIERSRIIADLLTKTKIPGLDYRNFTMKNKYALGALATAKKVFSEIKECGYGQETIGDIMNKLPRNANMSAVSKLINLYDEYDSILRDKGLIEFGDMEGMVFEILHNDPFYLESFGFRHIIVDEFQDSNKKEIEILKNFRDTPKFESLMVVGDDSQAIYSFKNTTPDFIINFSEAMGEKVDTINLMNNFRSQKKIIDFANKVNDKNVHRVAKSLIATRPEGKDVVAMGFLSDEEQQQWVADSISKKIASGIKPEDIAIIVRNKSTITGYVDVLNKAGIPTRISCPEKVLDNPRVKAAIGLFNIIDDPTDTADLLRYANCLHGGGIMDETPDYIKEYCDDILCDIENLDSLSEKNRKAEIGNMLKAIDSNEDELYNSFIENLLLRKTVQDMAEYAKDYEKFGSDMTFRRTRRYPGVQLITAHSSKGLEYPIVYDDISDYESKELRTQEDIEETRRLLFVSATRARDELYVLSTYVSYGAKGKHVYNRFLNESYQILGNSINASSVEAQLEALDALKKSNVAEKAKLEDQRAGITEEELQNVAELMEAEKEFKEAEKKRARAEKAKAKAKAEKDSKASA